MIFRHFSATDNAVKLARHRESKLARIGKTRKE
jgi:hypothetical protein